MTVNGKSNPSIKHRGCCKNRLPSHSAYIYLYNALSLCVLCNSRNNNDYFLTNNLVIYIGNGDSDFICDVGNDFNLLNAELNPIRHLLALVGARHIVHVSRIRVKYGSVTVQN